MRTPSRSYADDIRSRDVAQLLDLITARPDLVHPAPADLAALAARAATKASTQRALEQLSADTLHVLEAIVVQGDSGGIGQLLGVPDSALTPQLADLWRRALIWRSPEGDRPVRSATELLPHPGRLGPTARDLGVTDLPTDVDAAYAGLSASARNAIDKLRWSHPRASFTGESASAARRELVAAKLMAAVGDDDAVIPREVGLALRGGQLYVDGLQPPVAELRQLELADIDAAGGAEVLELLWRTEELATTWEQDPPRVLRSGGLSVRDHRAAARALDTTPEGAAFVIEIATAAGLFADDGELEPSWLPTIAYDDWLASTSAERWALLAETWWQTSRAPSIAGTTVDGTAINVLGADANWPLMKHRRHQILRVLNDLPPGTAPTLEYLDASLRWNNPLRLQPGVPTHVDVVLQEAEWLGLVARGALTQTGRALVNGAAITPVMTASLPEPVDHILVQADLTAIAPGPLTDDLRRFMHSVSHIESRGGATVFRFTPESIRRALDHGMTAHDVTARITAASRTPVPQPLEYLVADVARRHGQVRVGSMNSYVRSDDTASLDALLADRTLQPLQLRRIGPTVIASSAPPQTVLDMLRAGNHSPVAETPDGSVISTTGAHPRTTPKRKSPAVQSLSALGQSAALALIDRLRSATPAQAADDGPRIPSNDPAVNLVTLQDAAADGATVWVGYVDQLGDLRRVLFRPQSVRGGRATGTTPDGERQLTFSIHRITGVTAAQ